MTRKLGGHLGPGSNRHVPAREDAATRHAPVRAAPGAIMQTHDGEAPPLGRRLPERKVGIVAARRTRRFVRGPIPWEWLRRAARLPGAALAVALALWHLEGMRRGPAIPLGNTLLAELGVERHAKYRALAALESAGLITVTRRPGRNPRVTNLEEPRT